MAKLVGLIKNLSLITIVSVILAANLGLAEEITLKTIMPSQESLRVKRGVVGDGPDYGTGPTWNYEDVALTDDNLIVGGKVCIGTNNSLSQNPFLSTKLLVQKKGITTISINSIGTPGTESLEANIQLLVNGEKRWLLGQAVDTERFFIIDKDDKEIFTIKNGKVGIGIRSPLDPAVPLHIKDNDSYYQLKLEDSTGIVTDIAAGSSLFTIQDAIGNRPFTILRDTSSNAFPDKALTIASTGNVGIGTTDPGTHKCYINGTGFLNAASWDYGSDIRLKENVSYIQSGLEVIEQLKPVKFDYINGDKRQAGFVAQEVQEVLPDIITKGTDGMLGMKTNSIIPYLVKAIQEQQKKIESLETRLNINAKGSGLDF